MKCVGFWKENLKSYLITYDELDPLSKYRCWVYQRADLNRVLMSQAIGPFCDLKQDVYSWNYTEGATVAIEMQEYEREPSLCWRSKASADLLQVIAVEVTPNQ
nr:unnamed protein product [Callosobruchus analis]